MFAVGYKGAADGVKMNHRVTVPPDTREWDIEWDIVAKTLCNVEKALKLVSIHLIANIVSFILNACT